MYSLLQSGRCAVGGNVGSRVGRWIETLSAAIRKHDRPHLITVGLVPWSLDRPGLTSGFVPEKIVEELDFVSVHLYPERCARKAAVETLAGFSVGKPGSGVNDRVMLRYGDDAEVPIALAGGGESFTFVDHVYGRIGKETVEVSGHPRAMKICVKGNPKLVINGKVRSSTVADGLLTFEN